MGKELLEKIRRNKWNNQLMVHFSRKRIKALIGNNKNPKFIRIRKEDLVF